MSNPARILMLRGINIGPHNRISMPDLRAMFQAAGISEVKTYVQSGNVVLSSEQPPGELARHAEQLIAGRFGLSIQVLARTRDELADVIARDPFSAAEVSHKLYQVTFLAHEPDPDLVTRVAALASGSERFVARGREWYALHPEGVARSKLAARMSARNLGVRATARNWTTVRTLLAMADEL
jgi:uncharacterized protein (DUF1697 family)